MKHPLKDGVQCVYDFDHFIDLNYPPSAAFISKMAMLLRAATSVALASPSTALRQAFAWSDRLAFA